MVSSVNTNFVAEVKSQLMPYISSQAYINIYISWGCFYYGLFLIHVSVIFEHVASELYVILVSCMTCKAVRLKLLTRLCFGCLVERFSAGKARLLATAGICNKTHRIEAGGCANTPPRHLHTVYVKHPLHVTACAKDSIGPLIFQRSTSALPSTLLPLPGHSFPSILNILSVWKVMSPKFCYKRLCWRQQKTDALLPCCTCASDLGGYQCDIKRCVTVLTENACGLLVLSDVKRHLPALTEFSLER